MTRRIPTERAYSISLASLQSGKDDIKRAKGEDGVGTVAIATLDEPYISIQNHPSGGTFSTRDVTNFLLEHNEKTIVVIGNNGCMYTFTKATNADTASATPIVSAYKKGEIKAKSDEAFWEGLRKYGIEYEKYA